VASWSTSTALPIALLSRSTAAFTMNQTSVHDEPDQRAWDAERTVLLSRSGITVLRFADDTPDETIRARLALLNPP